MELEIYKLALIVLITFGGSYIQGVTGFGFGIFAMIFLPSILLFTEANLLSSILSSVTAVLVAVAMYRKINWKNLIFPLIGNGIANYFAITFLKSAESETLTLLLGIALFLLSIYFFFFTDKIKINPTWYAGFTAGIMSGVMSGLFAMGGPPVVIYYLQSEESEEHYLATISAYFVFSGVISVAMKIFSGFMTSNVWFGLALGALGMFLGMFFGKRTRDKTNEKMIKKFVYGFMAVSGLINIVTSLL